MELDQPNRRNIAIALIDHKSANYQLVKWSVRTSMLKGL
jgi:hypothetical protein